MLKKFIIDQFVIIEHMELEPKPGLTILTGETGAGKSILLDALGLVWGDPSNKDSIRQGSIQATIEAHFDAPKNNDVWKILNELEIVPSGEYPDIVVRRILDIEADDDISVNDKPVALEDLKRMGACLGEIHGQFANQSLLDPSNQMHLLDVSGDFPPEVMQNVAKALNDVNRLTEELREENAFLGKHKHELPLIEQIVKRFDDLGMEEGFIEGAVEGYKTLLTAKETGEAFQEMNSQLIATNGAVRALTAAKLIIDTNKNMDPVKIADLAGFMTAALDNAKAAVNEMARLAPEYDIDTRPLNEYRRILEELRAISKEVKVPLNNLSPYYFDMAAKLKRITNGRQRLIDLEDELNAAREEYRQAAHVLTKYRIEAGKKLSEQISAELPPLKLPRAQFDVRVEERMSLPWTPLGVNIVTFTARMNPGQEFSPVSETASGGELARLILALKVVLQKVVAIPTLIFDEIDTGIGGAAAAAVGERIAQLADTTQVFVITHSPQVASRHDHHLHVSKDSDGKTTRSVARELSLDETVDEISRMLAGEVITDESRANAQRLITEARAAAAIRRSGSA